MNSINLPCEYIMQMYVNTLAKKGVDKVLLLETLEEVNETTIKFLTMANTELMSTGKKSKITKAKKTTPKKKELQQKIDDIKANHGIEHKVPFKMATTAEKPTAEDVEKKFFGTPSPQVQQATCPFEFKGGKKNGTICGKPVVESGEHCATHTKKTNDKKNKTAILSDAEETSVNQVTNKKLAGKKNKLCNAHAVIEYNKFYYVEDIIESDDFIDPKKFTTAVVDIANKFVANFSIKNYFIEGDEEEGCVQIQFLGTQKMIDELEKTISSHSYL